MNRIKTAMLIAFMTALFMGIGLLIGGRGGMLIALAVALATNLFSYWNADRLVLAMNNAVEVDARSAPEFYGIIERLAARAGLPMPRVYLIEEDQPNAFATGRNPRNAAVAATTGLLARLSPDEVAGVMAHELAHVENRDTLIMTITATLAGAISMLGNFAFFFGGNRGNSQSAGILGTLVAVIVAPFAAMLVQMAISRTREYAADRRGAEIAGNPLALASALAKIAGSHSINEHAERNPSMAHLFIVNPLSGQRFDSLFSTHPAVENRIAALQEMVGTDPALTGDAAGPWARGIERDGGGRSVWGASAGLPADRRRPGRRPADSDHPAGKGPWG